MIYGGAGSDTVSYASSTGSVTVNLSTIAQQNTGSWGKDTLSNIENLIGSVREDIAKLTEVLAQALEVEPCRSDRKIVAVAITHSMAPSRMR